MQFGVKVGEFSEFPQDASWRGPQLLCERVPLIDKILVKCLEDTSCLFFTNCRRSHKMGVLFK